MRISSKGRYAVRVLCEIASNKKEYVSASEIATNQDISVKYLEHILSILLKSKLIESQMGAGGGYKLTKPPKNYSVAEILSATGDLVELAPCQEKGYNCNKKNCPTCDYWFSLAKIINSNLKNVSLADILAKKY